MGAPLTESDAIDLYLSESGTWKIATYAEFSSNAFRLIPGAVAENQLSVSTDMIIRANGSSIESEDCSLEPAQTSITDDSTVDDEDCDIDYYAIDENTLLSIGRCEDEAFDTQIQFSRVSNDDVFNSADLEINSTRFGRVVSSNRACNRFFTLRSDLSVASAGNEEDTEEQALTTIQFSVVAPLKEGKVEITFTFSFFDEAEENATLTAGTYQVVEFSLENTSTPSLAVFIDSTATGEATMDYSSTFIDSGTVTIDSIEAMNITGSFSLITEHGETLTGSFNTVR